MFLVSLPVRECGLKCQCVFDSTSAPFVTPRAGVWIEMQADHKGYGPGASLPVRECGLKSSKTDAWATPKASLPVRECGLKYEGQEEERAIVHVTPRAGVWIEITGTPAESKYPLSLPVRECGLKFQLRASTRPG